MNRTFLLLTILSVYAMHAVDGDEVELRNQRLLDAALNGHVDVVRDFLGRGADVEARSGMGTTSLHRAAMRGHVDVARELVAYGADLGARDRWQETPLHYAAVLGKSETVKFLLESGADVTKKNKKGKTPADLAQENGHNDLATYIRNYEDIPVTKGVMEDI